MWRALAIGTWWLTGLACGGAGAPTGGSQVRTMTVEEDVDEASGAMGGVDDDEDRVLDRNDQCVGVPEDIDAWQDEDGCPDPDDDQDRIADADDRCPGQAETYNGTDDADGCPDRPCVRATQSADCIVTSIHFDEGSGVLRPEALPLVEAVAQAMLARAEVQVLEIRGHADSREPAGTAAARTAVVHAYLAERGVAASRLVQRVVGTADPRDRSGTAEGRARNRRVDFRIAVQEHEGLATGETDLTCSPMGVVLTPRTAERCRE